MRYLFLIIVLICSFLVLMENKLPAEIKSAAITNFTVEELPGEEGTEITVYATYCLKDSKLFAIFKNKKKGFIKTIVTKIFTKNIVIDETIELPRIYYDVELCEAVFSGIVPFEKNEVDISLKLNNYSAKDELLLKQEEQVVIKAPKPAPIIMTPVKHDAEEKNNAANEEYFRDVTYSAQKKQEQEKNQQQTADEVIIVVVVLLPMLLEFANKSNENMDSDD